MLRLQDISHYNRVSHLTGALKCYDLNPEHRAALAAGDIESIERWVDPLGKHLHLWIKSTLEKENFSET